MDEDDQAMDKVHDRTWAELEVQHPRSYLEIDGCPDHYLAPASLSASKFP